jgi:hypothetical protein
MDFTLSKEHEMLQKAVREFAKKKIGSLGTGKPPPKMSESSPSAEDRRILLVKPS